MFCPKCRGEYREGVTRCAICDVDLIAVVPPADPFESPEKMAEVLKDKDLEALMVGNVAGLKHAQSDLAKRHIASVIAPEGDEELQPGLHARLFLLVAQTDLEAARQYIEDKWAAGIEKEGVMFHSPVSATNDATRCPGCGEPVPASVSTCPSCELFLGDSEAS